jgi:Mce-associated membrane protein
VPSSMPPRRRPGQAQQPVRRPRRVAGLHHPSEPARPETPGPADTTETGTETVEAAAERTEVLPVVPAEPARAAEPKPRPRPSGKRSTPPTAKPGAEPEPTAGRRPRRRPEPALVPERPAEPEPDAVSAAADVPAGDARRERSLLLPLALGVVTVLVGGLAVWFGVQWSHAKGSGTNTALVDAATTSEVAGQVTTAVNSVFSYDYTNLAKTEQAVPKVLTGTALCQYNELFKEVRQQAPGQRLVLTTTVQDKGVELLQGDRARVLLALDQHDTRAQTNQTTDSQAVIAVNVVRQGGAWKISSIDTFNGANPTSCRS